MKFKQTRWFIRWSVLGVIAASVLLPFAPAHAATPALFNTLQSDASRVVLELNVNGYNTRALQVGKTTFTLLTIPSLDYALEPGKPQLPKKSVLIGIPPGTSPVLKIIADDTQTTTLANPPLPVPTDQVQPATVQALPARTGSAHLADAAAYSANQFYPAQVARIVTTGAWRSQSFASIEINPLQYNPATKQLILHRRVRIEVAFTYASGSFRAPTSAVSEGKFEPVFQNMLANYASASSWRFKSAPRRAAASSVPYTAGVWYKVAVERDGVYQITCAQLQNAGVDLNALDLNTLKLFKHGNEIAIATTGQCSGAGGGEVEFFGQATRTRYTDTNVYWLTFGGNAGKRMTTRDGGGTGTPVATHRATAHVEQDKLYRSSAPMVDGADHWYWNYVPNGTTYADYPFTLAHVASGAHTATLTVRLTGSSNVAHRTQISLNGNLLDDTAWSGAVERVATLAVPQTYLVAGANTLRVNESATSSYVYVNHFEVNYARAFGVVTDTLRFSNATSGAWQYAVTGFSHPSVVVFDVTDAANVARLTNVPVAASGATYTATFADALAAPREYLALTTAQRQSPASIARDVAANLGDPANGADYIIITPGAFSANIQPLAAWRAAQGMRVKVVEVQDIYDEFSDGVFDAQALRDFLAYAYANWQAPAPAFVLLNGDGHYDFKNALGKNEANWIPPYLKFVDLWLGEIGSDNRYVTLNADNNLPSMAIGRLPATSAADVDAMVAKILRNEQNPAADAWRAQVTFVTDNPDTAGYFPAYSDLIATDAYYLPAPYTANRIYYSQVPYTTGAAARDAVVADINRGNLLVNYVGHGFINLWASERIFQLSDLDALSNTDHFPVMLSLSCYVGYFFMPGNPSLGEASVRAASKGMLASWSSAGMGLASGQDFLDRGFFEAINQRGLTQIGQAAVYGKTLLWQSSGGMYGDSIDMFTLFGDPATRLAVPSASGPTPTPTATNTPLPTATATPTNTPLPTPTSTPSSGGNPKATSFTMTLPFVVK